MRADRDIDPDGRGERRCPWSGGQNDGGGVYFGAVGQDGTVDRAVGVRQQRSDRCVLADPDAECARGGGESHAGRVGLATTASGFVGEGGEIVGIDAGPQLGHCLVSDELDVDAEVLLHRDIAFQRVQVGVADTDHVAALPKAHVVAEQLGGPFEDLDAVPGHRRERLDAVMAAHHGAGLAGHPRAQRVALDHQDIGLAALGERPRDGQALQPAADHQVLRCLGHCQLRTPFLA